VGFVSAGNSSVTSKVATTRAAPDRVSRALGLPEEGGKTANRPQAPVAPVLDRRSRASIQHRTTDRAHSVLGLDRKDGEPNILRSCTRVRLRWLAVPWQC
jgi:hypothetical protein